MRRPGDAGLAVSGERLGFRRWHERQLYRSFGWLTLRILCGVAFAAMLEGLRTPGVGPYVTAVVLYGVGLLAIAAWRRFWTMLSLAQHSANRAVCRECGAYGLFDVRLDGRRIPATCRSCGNRWTIE